MLAAALPDLEPAVPRLTLEADLFGRVLWEYYQGTSSEYFIRRDDNYGDRDSTSRYFRSWDQLPAHHRCLLSHAKGRVLDFGAGAGQHALALQEHGLEVTAIDISPRAVALSKERGVRDAQVMDGMHLTFEDASFDTVIILGNNLGIAGTPDGLRRLLASLRRIVRPGGQILAEFNDHTATHDPTHLRYQQWNVARGRYPGSVNIRVEHDGCCSPFFDWLLPKLGDLRTICADTGWKIDRCVQVTTEATYAVGIS
ncbi:MAG: class I SAM-dependent methyltransferase [Armatimonadota bacterium]